MPLRSGLAILCVFCAFAPAAWTADANADPRAGNTQEHAVDALFANTDPATSPGAAVGVYRHGVVVYAKGFGRAHLEQEALITPQTVFHAASVSKQFTAFAIALLEREGTVNLDADIRTYLPYVPDFGHPITVRELLHHTSGLRDQVELAITRGETRESLLRQSDVINMVARQRDLNFVPGSEYSYGNTDYTLLAEIVKAVSGRTLRQFTTERIFRPLGMTHTFFGDDITEVVSGRAQSYARAPGGEWRRVPLNFETVGATGLLTTLDDMLKWAANFSRPVVGDAALIEHITSSGRLNNGAPVAYGFGLELPTVAGRKAVMHMGYDAGFRAVIAYFPKEDFAIVILRNDGGDPHYSIAAIADIYLNGGRDTSPGIPAPITPDRARLAAYAGYYLSPFGKLVTLRVQDDRLLWHTAGEDARPLIFRADGSFDPGAYERIWNYYRFRNTGRLRNTATARDAILEQVSTDGGGIVTRYERVEPAHPSPRALADLAGDYRSAELDVTYTFSVQNDHLVARSIRLDKTLVFEPSAADRFDSHGWEMSTITFERDSSGRSTALRANVGNSRNLRFEKVRS